jgi:hypothetical protein
MPDPLPLGLRPRSHRHLLVVSLEPKLLLSLSKLLQSIGDEDAALTLFQKAAGFVNQKRGFYTDIGSWLSELSRSSKSNKLRAGVKEALRELLSVCPFREDLLRVLGPDY